MSIGTGFLRCPEAGTDPTWSAALDGLEPEGTLPTRAFTGRLGRAVANDYAMAAATPDAPAPAPYPVQRGLVRPMTESAAAAGDRRRMQMWAGQSAALAKPIAAADLVHEISRDATALLPPVTAQTRNQSRRERRDETRSFGGCSATELPHQRAPCSRPRSSVFGSRFGRAVTHDDDGGGG